MRAQIHLQKLKRERRLLESLSSWDYLGSPEILRDRLRGRDGDGLWLPVGSRQARRHGVNYPLFQDEKELEQLRGMGRVLCSTNAYAIRLMELLTSFVIDTGFTYRCTSKDDANKNLVAAVQDVVDHFTDPYGPAAWPELEAELFWRSREDGEFFLRHDIDDDGHTWIRTIEPEQVKQPQGTNFAEWSFGIRTLPDDVQKPLAYWVEYLDDTGNAVGDGEELEPSEVVHCKVNVKRSIKRGLTDFSYGVMGALDVAARLQRCIGEGAAVQAATAEILQHEQATKAQVEALVTELDDYTRTREYPTSSRTVRFQDLEPGASRHLPKGMTLAPLPNSMAPQHIEALRTCLHAGGGRWGVPSWVITGASEDMAAYTASLVAESPFVKRVRRAQTEYGRHFLTVIWAVVRNAVKAGRLPPAALKLVQIQVEAPKVETRNHLEEAQVAQIYVGTRIKSPQTIRQEQGLDSEQEDVNFQEFDEKHGQQGSPLGMPGDEPPGMGGGPPAGGGPPKPPMPGLESIEADLEECGGEGGKPGPCPEPGSGEAQGGIKGKLGENPEHRPHEWQRMGTLTSGQTVWRSKKTGRDVIQQDGEKPPTQFHHKQDDEWRGDPKKRRPDESDLDYAVRNPKGFGGQESQERPSELDDPNRIAGEEMVRDALSEVLGQGAARTYRKTKADARGYATGWYTSEGDNLQLSMYEHQGEFVLQSETLGRKRTMRFSADAEPDQVEFAARVVLGKPIPQRMASLKQAHLNRQGAKKGRLAAPGLESIEKADLEECGGEGGKPGPCPEPGAGGTSGQGSPGKLDRLAAVKQVLGRAQATAEDVKAVAGRIGAEQFGRLPPKVQRTLALTYQLAKAVEHKAMIGFAKGKEMAQEVARQRGLPEAHVEKVGRVLGVADTMLAWTVNFPAVTAATGSAAAGKVASFLPVASLAYVAYSTARDPFATARAAKAVLRRRKAVAHESLESLLWEMAENGDVGPEETAALLLQRMEEHQGDEWYLALLYHALDEAQGDLERAVAMADEAIAATPVEPGEGEDLQESKDATGHEHKGKGPGGGQFTKGGGGGGSGDSSSGNAMTKHDTDRLNDLGAKAVPNKSLPDESRPELSDSEIKEVQSYLSEDTEYYEVNDHLRSGGKLIMGAKDLQDAILKAEPFDKPVTVYRGLTVDDVDGLKEELESGTYSDRGFMSTSTASAFGGNVQLTIHARQGLDASFYGSNSGEMLLPAGSEFKVLSFEVKGGKVKATLEQIVVDKVKEGLVQEAEEDTDLGDPDERAGLIADILGGVFGDEAADLFDQVHDDTEADTAESRLFEAWSEIDHPRGKGGRFIHKGSAEAVSEAHEKVKQALKAPKTPESVKGLTEHLSILTVKQLHELKQKYGLKASAKNKEALRQKLADRLDRGRREGPAAKGGEEKPAEGKGKEQHEMTREEYARFWHDQESQFMEPHKRRTFDKAVADLKAAGGTDKDVKELVDLFAVGHRAHIEKALAAGKPVPPEVLADYPDLAAKGKEPAPAASAGATPTINEIADRINQRGEQLQQIDRMFYKGRDGQSEYAKLSDEERMALLDKQDRLRSENQRDLAQMDQLKQQEQAARQEEPAARQEEPAGETSPEPEPRTAKKPAEPKKGGQATAPVASVKTASSPLEMHNDAPVGGLYAMSVRKKDGTAEVHLFKDKTTAETAAYKMRQTAGEEVKGIGTASLPHGMNFGELKAATKNQFKADAAFYAGDQLGKAQQSAMSSYASSSRAAAAAKANRRAAVVAALSNDQPVSPEALAEFPDLAKAAGASPAGGGKSEASSIPPEEFGKIVNDAAMKSPSGWYNNNKVFINHVHDHLQKTDQRFKDMSLDEFKDKLRDARQAGHVQLSRADLVQAMNQGDVKQAAMGSLKGDDPEGANSSHFITLNTPMDFQPPGKAKQAAKVEPKAPASADDYTPEYQQRVTSRAKSVTPEQVQQLASAFDRVGAKGDGNFVHLGDLRKEMGLDRETFDAVLHKSRVDGVLTLSGAEGRAAGISAADRAAGIPDHTNDGALLLYASRRR